MQINWLKTWKIRNQFLVPSILTKFIPYFACNVTYENIFKNLIFKVLLCRSCCDSDHKGHVSLSLDLVPKHMGSMVTEGLKCCREKQDVLHNVSDGLHSKLTDISASRTQNKESIEDLCNNWINQSI